MTDLSQVNGWRESGQLESFRSTMVSVLERQRYSREQIENCFSLVVEVAYINGKPKTMEDFLAQLDVLVKREDFAELCMQVIDARGRNRDELMDEIIREADNAEWLEGTEEAQ